MKGKASTLHLVNKGKNEEEYVNYMTYLLQNKFTNDQIILFAIESTNFNFFYSLFITGINSCFKILIFQLIIYRMIKNLFLIGNKNLRKVFLMRIFYFYRIQKGLKFVNYKLLLYGNLKSK